MLSRFYEIVVTATEFGNVVKTESFELEDVGYQSSQFLETKAEEIIRSFEPELPYRQIDCQIKFKLKLKVEENETHI